MAGSPREILRVRGVGGLFEQLVDWLDKAAMAQLIDPQQGWEPVRRDGIDDVIVADADWLTRLPTRDGGCSVFPGWYYSHGAGPVTYRIGLSEAAPVPLGQKIVAEWRFVPAATSATAGTRTHWSPRPANYRPGNRSSRGAIFPRPSPLSTNSWPEPPTSGAGNSSSRNSASCRAGSRRLN